MKNSLPLLLAVFLASCAETTEKKLTEEKIVVPQTNYSVEFREFADRESDCEGDACTEIKISLPVLSGGDSAIAEKLNEEVEGRYRELVKSRLPEPRSTGSWESLTASFIEGYDLFRMEFPDAIGSWYLYLEGDDSELVSDSIYTVMIKDSEFMGGAHGNTATLVESYRLSDGVMIDFRERYGDRLKTIAEEKFRSHHNISANEPLNDAGFIFPEIGFILPENMGYTSKGLTLIYNPYEVAAYSSGATVLHIPISDLEQGGEVL